MGVHAENVRAIVFDLDRTLIISQSGFDVALKAATEQFYHHLKRQGILISKRRVYQELRPIATTFEREGLYNRDEWWILLLKKLGLSRLDGPWVHGVTMRYWREYIRGSPPYSDAEKTARTLKQRGYRLGMVTDTDGTPGMKRRRVRSLRFYHLFETAVVAGEDSPKIKPDKASFVLVAKRMRLDPEACVYVGDNPQKDVTGARVAGMQTIIVKRKRRLTGPHPDVTIDRLGRLLAIFKNSNN